MTQPDFTNIDPQEVAKFTDMADYWWNTQGACRLLHKINPLRLSYIEQYTQGLFGQSVLDIGCGGGILTESLAERGARVTGIDISHEVLEVARKHAIKTKRDINYLQATAEQHANQNPEYYDVITCLEMLEHVPDPQSIIKASAQLVKPGGKLFFSTINRTAQSWLLMILGAEYATSMIPKGTHKYCKFIKPSELLSWADNAQLTGLDIMGFRYVPLINCFTVVHKVKVNYIVCCQTSNKLCL